MQIVIANSIWKTELTKSNVVQVSVYNKNASRIRMNLPLDGNTRVSPNENDDSYAMTVLHYTQSQSERPVCETWTHRPYIGALITNSLVPSS